MRRRSFDFGLRSSPVVSICPFVVQTETLTSSLRLVGIASVLFLGGCPSVGCSRFTGSNVVPRSSVVLTDRPSLNQSGDALTGGTVTRSETTSAVVIPAGSVVDISGAGAGVSSGASSGSSSVGTGPVRTNAPQTMIRLSRETPLTTRTVTQTAATATTHEPAKPPTVGEVATAQGTKLFYYVAAFFAVASVFLFYSGHAKAGVFAAIGAGSLPLLSSLSQYVASHAALVFATVAASLVVAWYLVRRQEKDNTDTLSK